MLGDRARLQDALVTALRGAIMSTQSTESRVSILAVDRDGPLIRIVAKGAGSAPATVRSAAAVRVIQAHGGTVDRRTDALVIELPTE